MLVRAAVVVALLAGAAIASVKLDIYSNLQCTGTPTTSDTYQTDTCLLGGVVYGCQTGLKCVQVRLYDDGAAREEAAKKAGAMVFEVKRLLAQGRALTHDRVENGTCSAVLSTSDWVCDKCIGGSTGPSVTLTNCGAGGSTVQFKYCDSGNCQGTCRHIDVPRASCFNGTLSVDVVDCGMVQQTTYQNYNTCSGTVLDSNNFVANACSDGMRWRC